MGRRADGVLGRSTCDRRSGDNGSAMAAEKRRKRTKKRRRKDWELEGDRAYSRELKRHLKTTTAIKHAAAGTGVRDDFEPNAEVLEHTKKFAFVLWNGEEVECRIDESIVEDRSTLLAPGDRVLVEMVEDKPFIRAIAPRRTQLARPSIEGSRVAEQVVAANVDVLLIVVSARKPRFKPGVVDRYLILAELGGVEPIICLNKTDLAAPEDDPLDDYRELGYTVVRTSALEGEGLDELKALLHGKRAVFAGQSGVGKSSLLNALSPALDIDTQTVSSATEKGRHTTTAARLYRVDDVTHIIDTPGIRQLGIGKIEERDLPLFFPEFDEPSQRCRFRNCTHTHEPDCGVQAAVEAGEISERRYGSYLHILDSISGE